MEASCSWRPSGSLIACAYHHPGKKQSSIVFYERNGLQHYEFPLVSSSDQCFVHSISWNTSSELLAVHHTRKGDVRKLSLLFFVVYLPLSTFSWWSVVYLVHFVLPPLPSPTHYSVMESFSKIHRLFTWFSSCWIRVVVYVTYNMDDGFNSNRCSLQSTYITETTIIGIASRQCHWYLVFPRFLGIQNFHLYCTWLDAVSQFLNILVLCFMNFSIFEKSIRFLFFKDGTYSRQEYRWDTCLSPGVSPNNWSSAAVIDNGMCSFSRLSQSPEYLVFSYFVIDFSSLLPPFSPFPLLLWSKWF